MTIDRIYPLLLLRFVKMEQEKVKIFVCFPVD